MGWAGHVEGMGEMRYSNKSLTAIPAKKRPLRRPGRKCQDNIKELWFEGLN
jgi:hypothetical protein